MTRLVLLGLLLAMTSRADATRLTSTLVLAGDSIGLGSSAGDARFTLSHLLETRSHGRWLVLNHSYDGETLIGNPFSGRAPDAHEIWATYGVPLVELGTNDWATAVALPTFTSAYAAFLDGIRLNRSPIYCITPIWGRLEPERNAVGLLLQDYRDAITTVCRDKGAIVIDGLTLVPANPIYFVDGVHPNARGYRAMARQLAGVLRRTLR